MSLLTYVEDLPSSATQIRLPLLCAPHGTINHEQDQYPSKSRKGRKEKLCVPYLSASLRRRSLRGLEA